jgi:cytochrome c oxidase subunit 2
MMDFLRRILFLPEAGSTWAAEVDQLHAFVITMTMIGATGVAIVALAFFVKYRRRRDDDLTPYVTPTAIQEVIFIGLPLGLFLLWFAIGFTQFVKLKTPPREAMDVYVQGKKWMWKFAYPGGPNGADVLRVPAGRPVRLLMTSQDVIHSFYVPAMRFKMDVLPGRYTEAWFEATKPGRHPIFCAEFCGLGHSAMLGELEVLAPEEFDAWIAEARRSSVALAVDMGSSAFDIQGSLVDQGQRLAAEYGCLKCHSVDGSRHIGPTWLDLYLKSEKLKDGAVVVADEGYLTESMMDPRARIVAGYEPVMPTYQGRIPAPEIAAIVEFIKSLRTDLVRPEPSKGPVYAPVPGFDPARNP